MTKLDSHYMKTVEGDRLFSSKANSIEFFTTCHFIEKHLPPHSKIIELGAGHGTYSYYFSQSGHEVLATDIVQENVDAIQKLIDKENAENLKCLQLDATDLSPIQDNQYDLTLCLGPIYHLRNREDRAKCFEEAIRITKKNGIVAFAYINRGFAVAYMQAMGIKFNKGDYQAILDESWETHTFPDDFMNVSHYALPEQIEEELSDHKISVVSHIGVDGLYTMFKDRMNEMSDQEFDDLLHFHYNMATTPSSLGASCHNLIICRKGE